MDLSKLNVGELVKFDNAGDGPAWDWFGDDAGDGGPNFNVGLVTQIIKPVPERQQYIGEAEVRGEGVDQYAIDYNDVEAFFRRYHVQMDKLENICFIYHLDGEGDWDKDIVLRSKRLYTNTDDPEEIYLMPGVTLSGSMTNMLKLSPEEIQEFKHTMQRDEKQCREVMSEAENPARALARRQCEAALEFIELVKNYSTAYNPQQGDPDTTSSSSGMSTRKKAMIGAAGLAGLGGVALGHYLSGGKKKKRKTKRKKTKRRGTKRRRTKKRKSHKKYN
jgi:hypothetical protein